MTDLRFAPTLARWVLACLWAALCLPGCAITAPATAWRPAEIDVNGIDRISVLTFSGENGSAVSAALTTRLWENEFYALVDPTELQSVRMASATGPHTGSQPTDFLDSARTHNVDGLIVGDVIEYRCDDQVLTNIDVHVATDQTNHPHEGVQHEGIDVGVSHNQTIHREATVSMAFRMVEVATGKVRATRKTTRTFQGDITPGNGSAPAKGEVLDDLTQQCIDEFVAMLAPHEVPFQMPLARSHWFQRGQALVGKGNDFAKRGRWDEAIAAWQQALEVNAANDAALYNMAVARAAQYEYSQAEEFAIQAMNLKHKELYVDGLEQIRRLASDHDQTLRQRQHTHLLPAASRARQLMLSSR